MKRRGIIAALMYAAGNMWGQRVGSRIPDTYTVTPETHTGGIRQAVLVMNIDTEMETGLEITYKGRTVKLSMDEIMDALEPSKPRATVGSPGKFTGRVE